MSIIIIIIDIGTNFEDVFIDDFSSDEDDDADEEIINGPRCKALYHYSAKLNDELSLEPGKLNVSCAFLYLFVGIENE